MKRFIDLPEEVLHYIFNYIPEQDVFWNLGFCCLRLWEVVLSYVKNIELQIPWLTDDEYLVNHGSNLTVKEESTRCKNEMQYKNFQRLTTCKMLMSSVSYIALGKIKGSFYEEEILKDVERNNFLHCSEFSVGNYRSKILFANMRNEMFTEDDPLDALICRNFINMLIDNIKTTQGLWILGCHGLNDDLLQKMCLKYNDLRCINISSCNQITDNGFIAIFKCCKSLKRLDAKMLTNLTDLGVLEIEHDTILESLDIGYSFLTDRGISHMISKCPKAKRIDLGFCKNITDKVIVDLSEKCPHLEELILNRCKKLTDTGIHNLSKSCKHLTLLELNDCWLLTDDALKSIAQNFVNLRTCHLSNCRNVSDEGIKILSVGCEFLIQLSIDGCFNLTDSSVEAISYYCKHLEKLSLADLPNLTGKSIETLSKAKLENISSLDVSGSMWTSGFNFYLNDQLMKVLAKSYSFQEFHANHCYFPTDFGIKSIVETSKNLQILNLNHNSWLTNFGVKSITENCGRLKVLGLSCCSRLTDTSLEFVTSRCKNLVSLDVSGCRKMSFQLIPNLLQVCSKLKVLNIHGIKEKNCQRVHLIDKASNIKTVIKSLKERHNMEIIEFESLWYPLVQR